MPNRIRFFVALALLSFVDFHGAELVERSLCRISRAVDPATYQSHKFVGLRGGGQVEPALQVRLEKLLRTSHIMLFMKGSPDKPQCGFSNQIVKLLTAKSIEFKSFNILEDEEVRQGLKLFSDWPTYPQLYAGGKLIGGLDVVKELVESGELENELHENSQGTKSSPLSNSAPLEKISAVLLKAKIEQALKADLVEVMDMSDGCGLKFSVLIVSPGFEGQPVIERQRSVHKALEAEMPQIHALTLKCLTPAQHKT